jgi:hypothetical protein
MTAGRSFPAAVVFAVPFFRKKNIQYGNKYPMIPPLPPEWEYLDAYPIPIGYFEDILLPEFWDYVRQYGAGATIMGPKLLGSRILLHEQPDSEHLILTNAAPEGNIILSNAMSVEEERAANMENLRRGRARRIADALDTIWNRTTEPDSPLDSMDLDSWPEETDPNHYLQVGENFDTVSEITTEYDNSELPECPRYQEIRDYIYANRAQGRLCLETMDFHIPAYTLYHYIGKFGGISMTPNEWIAFLINCNAKKDLFS